MVTINLRKHYPHYKEDIFIEISDEIYEVILLSIRQENNYDRRTRYHKSYYSLDVGDGIENEALHRMPSPEEVLVRQIILEQLYKAMNALSETQKRRIYKRYFLGQNGAKVAREENVSGSSVHQSITGGLANLKKFYDKNKFER